MEVLRPHAIRQFVRSVTAVQDRHVVELASDCLYHYLQKGHRCRVRAPQSYHVSSPRLRRRFRKAVLAAERKKANDPDAVVKMPEIHLFRPDRAFCRDARSLVRWIDTLLHLAPGGTAREAVAAHYRPRLMASGTLEDLVSSSRFPPSRLAPHVMKIAAAHHPRFSDERNGHVRFETQLSADFFLVRIVTRTGLKQAAKKASNCLYSSRRPSPALPHRMRIRRPEEFAYFQVRDRHNNSLATIAFDFREPQYRSEANHRRNAEGEMVENITPAYLDMKPVWEAYFARLYPHFDAARPYGTQARLAPRRTFA